MVSNKYLTWLISECSEYVNMLLNDTWIRHDLNPSILYIKCVFKLHNIGDIIKYEYILFN